jgi:hypothetical protein
MVRASSDFNLPAEHRRDHFDDANVDRGEASGRELYNTHFALPGDVGLLSAGRTSEARQFDGEKVAWLHGAVRAELP